MQIYPRLKLKSTTTTYLYIGVIAQTMTVSILQDYQLTYLRYFKVISPALIMLRVLMGKALPEQIRHQSQSKMTTIRFGDEESGQRNQNTGSSNSELQGGEEESGEIRETTRSQGELGEEAV